VIEGPSFKILPGMNAAPEKVITNVPEIWTRFEVVEESNFVVKMHHSGWKVEIAVPI